MAVEKFGERAKEALLYEYMDDTTMGSMLEQTVTNSRTNEGMAIWIMSVKGITGNWKGNYKDMLFNEELNMEVVLQRHYLNMNGYARQQAIEMVGAKTSAEFAMAEKKKKGLLGLLGLGQ